MNVSDGSTANSPAKGHTTMGKKQRSLLLDEDLTVVIDAVQSSSGATFTRLMTAAVIKHLFDKPHPEPYWMSLAVALERGDLQVSDIPLKVANDRIATLEAELALFKETGNPDIDWYIADRQSSLQEAKESKAHWEAAMSGESDPINAVLTHFGVSSSDLPSVRGRAATPKD